MPEIIVGAAGMDYHGTEKITKCPNCGKPSFLDLMCADCTRAFGKGQAYEHNKKFNYLPEDGAEEKDLALIQCALGLRTCKKVGDAVEILEDAYKLGMKAERKRIIEKIKKLNKPEGLTMSTLNNEEVHILYDHDLAELEKGDA